MTVAKLIEVLRLIPDQQKDVYVQTNPSNTSSCEVVLQDDDGDIVLSHQKYTEIYFYPTQETKEKTNDRRTAN